MKRVLKVVLAAAAVAAMAVPAVAADKLVVKDNSPTPATVFKVTDTGAVTATGVSIGAGTLNGNGMVFNNTTMRYGFGTTNPLSALHLTTDEPMSANADRGLTMGQHGTNIAASIININRSRGTEASPTNLANGDNIAAFHAKPYDKLNVQGNFYMATASLIYGVDGVTSDGNAPTAIRLETGSTQQNRLERFRVSSSGRLRISNQPTAPANNAACTKGDMILDATNGFLYLCTVDNLAGSVVAWKRTAFASY